jgi:hypothetical protein
LKTIPQGAAQAKVRHQSNAKQSRRSMEEDTLNWLMKIKMPEYGRRTPVFAE